MKAHVALFGTVALRRMFCGPCGCYSLIRNDGTFCCCDKPLVGEVKFRGIKRVVEPEQVRRRPTPTERKQILEDQNHCCLYCERRLGSWVLRKNKQVRLRLHWDHMVPFSYQQNNSMSNFVAACHLCNMHKHSMIFSTLEEARIYLVAKQEKEFVSHAKETTS
jgi:5-methylcytosine-specific restriction endonuclease McrA